MIEIPDLDESSPYQKVRDQEQHFFRQTEQPQGARQIGNLADDYQINSVQVAGEHLHHETLSEQSLEDEIYGHDSFSKQDDEMYADYQPFSDVDDQGVETNSLRMPPRLPMNNETRINNVAYDSGYTSLSSLPLSDDSHEINAQAIEYNTAEPVYMNQVNTDIHQGSETPKVHVVSPKILDNDTFKLQDPPVFHAKYTLKEAEVHDLSDDELGELDGFKNINTRSGIVSQQLASPIASFTARDHSKPSPQLPPPISSISNKRLTLSNGEEFSYIRKELATYSKTPAEYTLHIVFTQFVRHAERKLAMCLDYPLKEEPPVIDLLSEGVNIEFDKIIASLGYIARRKPKPVIDSVMFWRKSKSEVALMAASEVEKILSTAKMNLAKTQQSNPISAANPGISKNSNSNSNSKTKRSLSLIRTKSFSKVASHSRNQSASSAQTMTRTPSEEQKNSSENEFSKQRTYYDEQITRARETAIQADRKSLASIYILCRVLIEVVKQASIDVMGDDLGDKLEEIVFTQLKTTDPVSTSESLVRSSNWNLFAELLGYMSEKRFLSVSDRFIANLENIPPNISQEDEPRLYLLIHGMRYLKLTNYPLETFEESAEFIQSLAKFFEKSKNESIIFAYCEVLSNLVLPLANILTAETNHPTWVEAIEMIYNKAYHIWKNGNKPINANANVGLLGFPASSSSNLLSSSNIICFNNSWAYSIHLMTSSLSVSRKELFSTVWFQIIEDNMFKLKPKSDTSDKSTFIVCIARLVWVYLYRLNDTLNNTMKKLDNLFNLLFFGSNTSSKKQQWLVSDTNLINVLVEFMRIVGYQHLNYVLDNVLLKLLKHGFNGISLENANPEKLILVVKSYLTILEDYELGVKPSFPTDDVFSSLSLDRRTESNVLKKSAKHNRFQSNEIVLIAKNSTNALSHEEICRNLATLIKLLDTQYGSDVWVSDGNFSSTPVSSALKSQSTFSAFHFGIDFSYQTTKDLHIELFSTLLEAIPWTLVPLSGEKISGSGMQFKSVVEILTRNAVHSNQRVAGASLSSLRKLASRRNPNSLITIFAKFAFQFSDKPGPNYNSEYLNSIESHKLLKIYVDLLNCWLTQFKKITESKTDSVNPLAQDDELMNKDVLNDLYQINYKSGEPETTKKVSPSDELEWKNIITAIEEIEGNGLFFLCSQDSQTRHYGISIMKLVEQFDQAIYNMTDSRSRSFGQPSSGSIYKGHSRNSSKFAADIGTRLIHILEDVDFLELIKPYKKELSMPERNRLSKLKNKKNILVKLAESDYGIDSTLWFRLYPKLLDIFFERCPMPVAMCRSIVCVRMVQMYELVLDFSDSYKNYTTSLFSRSTSNVPPEVLVNQWRLYLIYACCSLTSTNEQKISFPSQPTHGRKKSMQMFIQHQKITSAKSVFRMVFPFLRSQQPMVREAVISGLSCININIFKTLLENLPQSLNEWDVDLKKRDSAEDRLRIEVIHILCNISNRFKSDPFIYSDEWMIANLVSIVKNVKSFLSITSIQTDVEFQRLRRYFCGFLENIFVGLQDKSDLNKWLPFEARIGCFNFLKEWCALGYSADITENRYESMIKRVRQQKETTSTVAILEVEKKALQFSSLSCMAVLCSGPIKQKIEVVGKTAIMSFDIPDLMNWIHALFCSDNEKIQEIGQMALRNILNLNLDNEEIYQKVLGECYSSQPSSRVTEYFFTIFADAIIELKHFDEVPVDTMCLTSILIGHKDYKVRFAAIKLLKFLEEKFYGSIAVHTYSECVCSKTRLVYKRALFDISAHLSSLHPESAFDRISYLTKCFSLVGNDSRKDVLSSLVPWLRNVQLNYKNNFNDSLEEASKLRSANVLDVSSIMVLNNLFEITVMQGSNLSNEIESLWVALVSNTGNFDKIMEYVISSCLERKNASFVEHSRQVIDYLAFSHENTLAIIDRFIDTLQPRAMVPPQTESTTEIEDFQDLPYFADLGKCIPLNEKDAAFSRGQLSMVFLMDLFTIHSDRMVENLPLLLHVGFSLLDHYSSVIQESSGALLIHLVHTLAPNEPKSATTIESLRQSDHSKYLWVYDDLNNDKKGARTPKNMDLLARNVLEILTPAVPTLQDDWSRVSLNWATTCAVRHIACRSFQVFRSLLSFLDQGMLKDMLHRLSNTVSDETLDIQGFAMQILMTLNAITAELDSVKLIDFPQLFWSGVACLSTIHEQEFVEVLSTMSKFVSKIDLDAPDTVSCLISTFPPKWEGKFEGLQQIVMVGLRSATSWEPSMKFLDELNRLNDSEIIGTGDSRLLLAVLSNLPRFLHALDQKHISKEIEETATVVSKMADKCGKPALSRILVSMSKNRFRSKKDFLVQTVSTINNIFFPEYEAQTLVLLLGFLSNKIPWVKIETMSLLKHIFPLVDLERDEFVGVGADLISPLLRLLLTDFAEPALEVLDEAVIISGSQLDKDVLRMSLGNASMKKEYEKTATLFGIPDETGWAIPMPAVTATSTRNNVHAVFSTCAVTTYVDDNDIENESDGEIQFHMEDYYAPVVDHGDNASVSVEERDASLSNMWAALDDFDSFFTKDTDHNGPVPVTVHVGRDMYNHHIHSASVDTKNSNTSDPMLSMDSAPQVYDKKASVILNRSLARTQSNASFKNTLADSIGASDFANQGTSATTKRSYIPFRHNRNAVKTKNDSYVTPKMPSSPTFNSKMKNSPLKSPAVSNTTLTPNEVETSSPLARNTNGTIANHNSEGSMFENLMGGGKKKSRKSNKLSPNLNSSNSPPINSHYWNSNKQESQSPASNLSSPPSSASNGQIATQKNKEKKKPSQKFR